MNLHLPPPPPPPLPPPPPPRPPWPSLGLSIFSLLRHLPFLVCLLLLHLEHRPHHCVVLCRRMLRWLARILMRALGRTSAVTATCAHPATAAAAAAAMAANAPASARTRRDGNELVWRIETVRAPSAYVSMCSPPSGPCWLHRTASLDPRVAARPYSDQTSERCTGRGAECGAAGPSAGCSAAAAAEHCRSQDARLYWRSIFRPGTCHT